MHKSFILSLDAPKTISELEKMYTVSPRLGTDLPPLQIIDVGVPLPTDDVSVVAPFDDKEHKIASELAYRIQWRNYFRNEIFPRLLKYVCIWYPSIVFHIFNVNTVYREGSVLTAFSYRLDLMRIRRIR